MRFLIVELRGKEQNENTVWKYENYQRKIKNNVPTEPSRTIMKRQSQISLVSVDTGTDIKKQQKNCISKNSTIKACNLMPYLTISKLLKGYKNKKKFCKVLVVSIALLQRL